MPGKTKRKQKPSHGGRRKGAGRKPADALRCPTCVILQQQLQQAHEREQKLIKQLGEQSRQIGAVIESKFPETVRIAPSQLPQQTGQAFPVEQLTDVETVDDQQFIQTVSEMAH